MKKVLFATTALVATAGAASAQVALSGSAEMGIIGGNGTDTVFWQDIDVTFTMSGETDNGLTFGASVDIDETAAGTNSLDDNGTTVFLSGNFGTLTMGDTDGAMDFVLTEAGNVGNPGSLADDETVHMGYRGNYLDGFGDGQVLRYDNTFSGFTVAVSAEQSAENTPLYDTGFAVGFGYTFEFGGGSVDLGLGYQQAYAAPGTTFGGFAVAPGADTTAIGGSATLNLDSGFQAGVVYTEYDFNGVDDVEHIGLGVGYSTGPFAIHANWGEYSSNTFPPIDGQDGWGLAAAYDLGGGASVNLGWNDNPVGANWSLGVAMSF